MLDAAFVLGVLLIAAAIIARGLRKRPGGAEVFVILGVAAVYLLLFVRIENPAERTHLVEYGVIGVLIHEALAERVSNGRSVPAVPLLAILATATLGSIDEGVQALLPSRVFDLRDIVFNALAGLMAVTASVALAWARRRSER